MMYKLSIVLFGLAEAASDLNCAQMHQELLDWVVRNPFVIPTESQAGKVLENAYRVESILVSNIGSETTCHLAACDVLFALEKKVMKQLMKAGAGSSILSAPTDSMGSTEAVSIQSASPNEETSPNAGENRENEEPTTQTGVIQEHNLRQGQSSSSQQQASNVGNEDQAPRNLTPPSEKLVKLVKALSLLSNAISKAKSADGINFCAPPVMEQVISAGRLVRKPVQCNVFREKFEQLDPKNPSEEYTKFVGTLDHHFKSSTAAFKDPMSCKFAICEFSYKIAYAWANNPEIGKITDAAERILPAIEANDCSVAGPILSDVERDSEFLKKYFQK